MPFAGFKNSPNRFAGFQTTKYNFEREVLLFSPLAKRFSLMGKSARTEFSELTKCTKRAETDKFDNYDKFGKYDKYGKADKT